MEVFIKIKNPTTLEEYVNRVKPVTPICIERNRMGTGYRYFCTYMDTKGKKVKGAICRGINPGFCPDSLLWVDNKVTFITTLPPTADKC